jgi:hypothetical protein
VEAGLRPTPSSTTTCIRSARVDRRDGALSRRSGSGRSISSRAWRPARSGRFACTCRRDTDVQGRRWHSPRAMAPAAADQRRQRHHMPDVGAAQLRWRSTRPPTSDRYTAGDQGQRLIDVPRPDCWKGVDPVTSRGGRAHGAPVSRARASAASTTAGDQRWSGTRIHLTRTSARPAVNYKLSWVGTMERSGASRAQAWQPTARRGRRPGRAGSTRRSQLDTVQDKPDRHETMNTVVLRM